MLRASQPTLETKAEVVGVLGSAAKSKAYPRCSCGIMRSFISRLVR